MKKITLSTAKCTNKCPLSTHTLGHMQHMHKNIYLLKQKKQFHNEQPIKRPSNRVHVSILQLHSSYTVEFLTTFSTPVCLSGSLFRFCFDHVSI